MSRVEQPRVIVALDFPSLRQALDLIEYLDPAACRVKVGKELFVRAGPAVVEACVTKGFDVFLDLKFHDIPNTVAGACRAAAELGVWMVNVHASGGRAMMAAAADAVHSGAAGHRVPKLIAVTVLTSSGPSVLAETGADTDLEAQVLRLTRLTVDAGLDGVVCSAREASLIRTHVGETPLLVTPGIRPVGSGADDQTRILTPAEAIRAGADYLVVGRPITRALDPQAALAEINAELGMR
ncbi:MAG: orotidine-5'-phosphate decarboxylase [Ectothiorhodospiraceae bacterium]|nr:orotidine-5'-phosphate decarboxylase [Ectothiorhodospiraceae bacterium]